MIIQENIKVFPQGILQTKEGFGYRVVSIYKFTDGYGWENFCFFKVSMRPFTQWGPVTHIRQEPSRRWFTKWLGATLLSEPLFEYQLDP